MKVMLDTNICIAIIKRKPPQVLRRFSRYRTGDIGISAITLAELEFGVVKSRYQPQNQAALEEFVLPLEVAGFDANAAKTYGQIRATLETKGTPIGSMDTLIGAHALSLGVTLITNNTKEFSRIEGLALADWIEGKKRGAD